MRTERQKPTPVNFEEYKIRTSRLLHDLRSPDPKVSLAAAERFCAHPDWLADKPATLLQHRSRVQRKHALAVVAKEAGFRDWAELKAAMSGEREPAFDTMRLFPPRSAAFLNLWFRTYEEASVVLRKTPWRFLFPYKHQFFVCEPGFLEARGIDPKDPDWERIGHDWVRPRNAAAHARLSAMLRRTLG
jgi:hypothetical protein